MANATEQISGSTTQAHRQVANLGPILRRDKPVGGGWYEIVALIVALAVLAGFAFCYAWREPFNHDEYLVLQTALSGSPAAIWHILKTAPLSVDPPLFHLLMVYWVRLFGPSEFSTRIPSVLAYTWMSFLLYRFVRKYTDRYTGLTVLALCLQCGAFAFAYRARPYTLVLAADATALTGWSSLTEMPRKRMLSQACLFLGISLAVGSHWFGFLVLLPIALAEAMRTWQTRKPDIQVWLVSAAGAATVLAYLPLWKAASEYRFMPWKGVSVSDIGHSYRLILDPCVIPLAMLMVVIAVAYLVRAGPGRRLVPSSIPSPAFAGVIAFAAMPFAGFFVGRLVSGAFEPRYVLWSALGLLVLLSLAIREAVRRSAAWMGLAILVIGGYSSFFHGHELFTLPPGGDEATYAATVAFLAFPELPIVPSDNDLFFRMEAHGPAVVRARCVLVTDPISVRFRHRNTERLTTDALRQWTKFPIEDLSTFLKTHPQFYLVERAGEHDWLVQWLIEDRAYIALQGTYAGNPVYLVNVRP